ncbi:MAG TPA: hypothetical protein PLO56_12885 [Rhodothermales bacterium]|nr:hypothetical protein [Rhodothermales bacterium]
MKFRNYLLMLLCLATASCDSTFDPFVKSSQIFTILGYLDMGRSVHYLRVVPLRSVVTPANSPTIDAKVKTIDLNNGNVVHWRDSVITFPKGTVAHVFYARFPVEDNHTYRVEVTRSDGQTTSAETTVPKRKAITLGNIVVGTFGNGLADVTQQVSWSDVPEEPYDVEVWYRFFNPPIGPFVDAKAPYKILYGELGKVFEGSYAMTIRYSRDKILLKDKEIFNTDKRVLYGVGVRFIQLDDKWKAPNGVWDPDVIAQPNVLTNVTNGFGFFGSVGQFDLEWTLSDQVVKTIGYSTPGDR